MINQTSVLKRISIPAILLISTLPFQSAQAAKPSHLEHPHSAGTFMFEAMAMRMNMEGLRSGTSDVNPSTITNETYTTPYLMSPEDMTMDMFMLMPMYNFTKSLSVMGMLNYTKNTMSMTSYEATEGRCTSDMETKGLGDTQISLNYKFMDDQFAAGMELNLPTGSIDERIKMNMLMGAGLMCMEHDMFAPYAMQLGSGTYDFTPSITYLGAYYNLRYGAQASYKYRMEGDEYTLGNVAKTKIWIRKPVSMVTLSAELDVMKWGGIDGMDSRMPGINTTIAIPGTGGADNFILTPTVEEKNTGGTQADITIGASVPVSMVSLGLDITIPVYQDLNGLQMKRSWTTALSVIAMF